MNKVLHLSDVETTAKLAKTLASTLKAGDVLLCQGGMGAGKTTFIRSLIQHWLGDEHCIVTSPTFTLVQTYDGQDGRLWHYDLFRLEDPRELDELGIEEALEDICVVEWPEHAGDIFPNHALLLTFAYGQNAEQRVLTVEIPDNTPRWRQWFHDNGSSDFSDAIGS